MCIDIQKGDCLELMKKIPSGTVDMVLCDLPYGVTDYGWDKIIDGKKLFMEYKRVCKQKANVVLFSQIKFAKYLMDSTLEREFSHCLIWCKEKKTRFLGIKSLPLSQYEMILVFHVNKDNNKGDHKRLRSYFMQELSISGKSIKEIKDEIPNKGADHWFGWSSDYRIPTEKNYKRLQEITGRFKRPYADIKNEFLIEKHNIITYNGKNESDLLYFGLPEKRFHPTQKPVKLLEHLISLYSDPGDTIMDSCMGSGSTGVAAVMTGRKFIGFEKDDEWYRIASLRIRDAASSMGITI